MNLMDLDFSCAVRVHFDFCLLTIHFDCISISHANEIKRTEQQIIYVNEIKFGVTL